MGDAPPGEMAAAGHNVRREQPERFLAAVLAFLNEVHAPAVQPTR